RPLFNRPPFQPLAPLPTLAPLPDLPVLPTPLPVSAPVNTAQSSGGS
ncbi:MAG: hypothetical protein HC875_32015, partial [Anaerolineales bacterium]|nr:hypothetical protein [Anaerolineales bacterium]